MHHEFSKEKMYDAILNGLPVGMFVVDDNMKIIEFNPSAELLTGWKREDAVGKTCSEVFQSSLCKDNCPLEKSVLEKKAFIGQEAIIINKLGGETPISFTSSAVLGDNGRMVAGLEIFEDGTESKRLEMLRRNFISVFTHDLKEPVAITGAFLNRLLLGKAGELSDKQKQYLEAVHKENRKLGQYIKSFLDTLQLEAGQLHLSYTLNRVEKILYDLIEDFKVKSDEKNISIHFAAPESLPRIYFDQAQLERAFSNLLDNAIKYSEPGSEIKVYVTEKEDSILFEIRDQGFGISKKDLPHIFEYFYRAQNRTDQISGTGLGLASVRGIVEAHGGKIWVRSEKGKGSSFFLLIPKKTDDIMDVTMD